MKTYKIAVAGTGYVGLSLSVLLAQHNQVMAVDIVQSKVDMINNHKSPIQDDYIEKYLAEKELNLTATLDAKAACKQIVEEKKLENNIIIVGWADFDKKLELLKKSSVLVLPSYNEGLPMAILEGMACGKAIISTTVGAIPEVVKEENGILIEPGDIKKLSEALIGYCMNQEIVERTGKNNIALI